MVIGAQKCGTSGLHYYLGLHPEVSMSSPKELNFFIEERKMRFEVNVGAAQDQGIRLSSQLLRLAKIVSTGD